MPRYDPRTYYEPTTDPVGGGLAREFAAGRAVADARVAEQDRIALSVAANKRQQEQWNIELADWQKRQAAMAGAQLPGAPHSPGGQYALMDEVAAPWTVPAGPSAGLSAGTPHPMVAGLAGLESSNNYAAKNQYGYMGLLQFGEARLKDAKAAGVIPAGMTLEQFRNDPVTQDRVNNWHFYDIDRFIAAKGLNKYIGQTIKGIRITQQGMEAAAHIGGKQGLLNLLESGGGSNKTDANGTSMLDYMAKFSGPYTGAPDPSTPREIPVAGVQFPGRGGRVDPMATADPGVSMPSVPKLQITQGPNGPIAQPGVTPPPADVAAVQPQAGVSANQGTVAAAAISGGALPSPEAFLMDATRYGVEIRQLDLARQQAEYDFNLAKSMGDYEGMKAAIGTVNKVDLGFDAVEGWKAIADLQGGDAKPLAVYLGKLTSGDGRIEPRRDGKFNLYWQGKKVQDGLTKEQLAAQLKMVVDENFKAQVAAGVSSAQSREDKAFESALKQLEQSLDNEAKFTTAISVEKVKAASEGAKVTANSDGSFLLAYPGGRTAVATPVDEEINGVKTGGTTWRVQPIEAVPTQ